MSAISSKTAEQELDQSIVRVMRDEPFFGHLLGSVIRRLDSQIPTAAVTLSPAGVSLVVNPKFFMYELMFRYKYVNYLKHMPSSHP